ncbi:HNH endonuclease [Nocardioides seonyuensis]|uniref:HNH endonuclease n=2 Tax=Nocardioides seonyuensis TaxID=2518371 RepID=A0A4P7ILM1_9ACTN|nr:HNH endonuclease [Nocardioides seonyuensis]
MGVISDLLGIEHFTTSRGSKVRKDFLQAVGKGLGLPETTIAALETKDDVLTAVVEAATQEPMDPGLLSRGGTVTNEALQIIIDGITRNGVVGRPQMPDVEPELVAEAAALGIDFEDFKDARDRRLIEMAVREGQNQFRNRLLDAYDGKCAVTGYDAVDTLEAAHIYPYRGPATNHVTNGLLLRADIHKLFDRGGIAIHETSHHVLVRANLMVTAYAPLSKAALRLPRRRSERPSTAALRSHREWAGLV